jgi:hypothetical protein
MGSLGMDEAPDGSESLVVLEVRNWGNRIMQINRTALQQAYDEDQARMANDPDALQLVPWSPGDPVGNSISATLWRRWAERILVQAIQGNRGGNFTR